MQDSTERCFDGHKTSKIIKLKKDKSVEFINISVSSFGVLDKECSTFFKMLDTLGLGQKERQHTTRKMISIAIKTTYYIFCCRNKDWTNSKLLSF